MTATDADPALKVLLKRFVSPGPSDGYVRLSACVLSCENQLTVPSYSYSLTMTVRAARHHVLRFKHLACCSRVP